MLKFFLKTLITAYRLALSPLLPPACRFHPTCSEYALDAIDAVGPARGAVLAVKRVLRCHPLGKGGFDPAPSGNGQMAE